MEDLYKEICKLESDLINSDSQIILDDDTNLTIEIAMNIIGNWKLEIEKLIERNKNK